MSETLQGVVADALTYLTSISREGVPPREAQRHLRVIQAKHPSVRMELVWEAESYDGSLHYDVLLRPGDGTTVSLSFCLDRALPWPLRGVRRWSDAELAQVNGQLLTMQQAVALLDIVWNEASIMDRMINACLIREELERLPIEISDEDLQLAMDGLRRANRLFTLDETVRWMQQRGLTHEHLEQLAADSLSVLRLRGRVTAGRIEAYFEEHRAELDTAHVARIACSDAASAELLHRQIIGGEVEFFEAAQRHFVAAPHRESAFFASLRRRDVPRELGAAIFAASPGDVVGPTEHGTVITRLLSVTQACLDAKTRTAIEELLFEEWLTERRHAARITWHWGTADRTSHAA